MSSTKRAFYPSDDVEALLKNIPRGQVSSRINELILEGLSFEHRLKIEQDYMRFNEAIAKDKPRKKDTKGDSSTMLMSAKLFEPEDEGEDFI